MSCVCLVVNVQLFVRDAQKIWDKMQEVGETREEAYRMTHDGASLI